MIWEISKTYTFEAAHSLPQASTISEEYHPCSVTHGHSYMVEITIKGKRDSEKGWVLDFSEIDEAWKPIGEQLDHKNLNDIHGLTNPTSENLSMWIWNALKHSDVRTVAELLYSVTVHETRNSRCTVKKE